jgi:hypothetical protein
LLSLLFPSIGFKNSALCQLLAAPSLFIYPGCHSCTFSRDVSSASGTSRIRCPFPLFSHCEPLSKHKTFQDTSLSKGKENGATRQRRTDTVAAQPGIGSTTGVIAPGAGVTVIEKKSVELRVCVGGSPRSSTEVVAVGDRSGERAPASHAAYGPPDLTSTRLEVSSRLARRLDVYHVSVINTPHPAGSCDGGVILIHGLKGFWD